MLGALLIDRSASLLPVTVTVLLLLLPGTGSVWPGGSVTVPTLLLAPRPTAAFKVIAGRLENGWPV